MAEQQQARDNAPIYRVNKFTVPMEARATFLDILESTLALMREQAGFVRSLLLEQQAAPDLVQVVAVHEFTSDNAARHTLTAIADADREAGFDRPKVVAGLGIKVEMGNYHLLDMLPISMSISARQKLRAGFPQ